MAAATFEEFLRDLDTKISGFARAVATPPPILPIYKWFRDPTPALTEATKLILENDIIYHHTGLTAAVIDPLQFYRGFSHGLSAIHQDLDCPRELTDDVLLEVFLHKDPRRPADVSVIKASAGAGKMVVLHRLAYKASAALNLFCITAKQCAGLPPDALIEISDQVSERIFLFVDDVSDYANEVERLLETARKRKIAITIVAAERTNEWNIGCDALAPYTKFQYELGYLNNHEIDLLLDLLERHRALGTLDGQSRKLQEEAFKRQANRQLLVAMHEATLGKPFEDIVKDEYDQLIPQAAKEMYLTICTLNCTGIPVRAGLIKRVYDITFEDFKDKFFRPLEHVVFTVDGRRGYDSEYRARHPHVAELVFRQVFRRPEDLLNQFQKIIKALNMSYESDRHSFRQLINARSLRDLFSDHQSVSQIYELAKRQAPDDGHVLLQQANYEMRRLGGSLDIAQELLGKAHELLPRNLVVTHTYAELEIELAEKASNPIVRAKHLDSARSLVSPLIGPNAKGSHGYHTAFKAEHMRLRDALACGDDNDEIAIIIRNVESVLTSGLQHVTGDSYLLSAESELATTLQQNERARIAPEKAVKTNLWNVYAVSRLARLYTASRETPKARALLEEAIEAVPVDGQLNFLYAKTLMSEDADEYLIKKHLRSAFNEGDRNLEARFWYARQLYMNGKLEDAGRRFDAFSEERVEPHIRFAPRATWEKGGMPIKFSGRIIRLEAEYGVIIRDGEGDTLYVRRPRNADPLSGLQPGMRVRFEISFNFRGPAPEAIEGE